MAEDIFDEDENSTQESESFEEETQDVAQSFHENQTSEELQDLMDQEGLVASPEEPAQEVFIEETQLKSLIESILFSSPKPMTFDAIKQVFKGTNIKSKELRKVLHEYAQDLANVSRGVFIEEVAGGYQLRTKLENVEFLKQAVRQKPFRISGPSMEVLAIIAYKQPCIKAEVDTIRGVESGHLIRVLMDKGLVQFDGKSDLPGKPMLYKTTKKFLEVFGLRNIRELPTLEEIDQLIPEGIGPETEEKKTLSDMSDELTLDYARRDMEAEEEYEKIAGRLSDISTTSEYFEKEKERQRLQRDKDRADDIRERMILGQLVEEREINWLKRFEEKMMEPQAEVMTQEAIVIEEEVVLSQNQEEAIQNTATTFELKEEIFVETKQERQEVEQSVEQKLSGLAGAAKNAFESLNGDETESSLQDDEQNKDLDH